MSFCKDAAQKPGFSITHLQNFIFIEDSRHLSFAHVLEGPDLSSHLFQLLEGLLALPGRLVSEGLEGQLDLGQVGLGRGQATLQVCSNTL